MIPATQREALAVLTELCELSEDMRLGQLIAWVGDLGKWETGLGLADIEDEHFLKALYQHKEQLAARLTASQNHAARSDAS
jgi:hypothetical protein